LSALLDRLIRYTEFHFAHEERILERVGYTDLQAHRSQHAALTRRVVEFQTGFEDGNTGLMIAVLVFLKAWLVGHIQTSDAKYAPFVVLADSMHH
jgi:hemerythrin-like metal-binding protein